MKRIALTQGKFALIDDEDFERVNQYKWCSCKGYAMRRVLPSKKAIYLHRFVLGISDNKVHIDHKDRNPLNNQKFNLRLCTYQQNNFNKKISSDNTSGFRGVHFENDRKKWRASIHFNYKRIWLGQYDNPIDAAKAYNLGAIKYHGEFAVLNKIP